MLRLAHQPSALSRHTDGFILAKTRIAPVLSLKDSARHRLGYTHMHTRLHGSSLTKWFTSLKPFGFKFLCQIPVDHAFPLILTDGVPCSQNPTEAIEAWINFNKEEREAFAESLRTSLKVRQICLELGHCNSHTL